jgi:hypothetical protein
LRRRRLPSDLGERQAAAVAPNVLDRSFEAPAPNRKWIADFTYIWTAEGWLYVAAVIDLFSRRVVGWSMSAGMSACVWDNRSARYNRTLELAPHQFRPVRLILPRQGELRGLSGRRVERQGKAGHPPRTGDLVAVLVPIVTTLEINVVGKETIGGSL